MALVAGSVTVDDDGNETGSGLALDLYQAELDAFLVLVTELGVPSHPLTVAGRKSFAAKANSTAAAIVAAVGAGDVRVLANALGSGVPASTTVLAGAVE